jgi:hypothetical protein
MHHPCKRKHVAPTGLMFFAWGRSINMPRLRRRSPRQMLNTHAAAKASPAYKDMVRRVAKRF